MGWFDFESGFDDWIDLVKPDPVSSSDALHNLWAQKPVYGSHGTPDESYRQAVASRAAGYGASPAEIAQQQAIAQATGAGLATQAANQRGMGAAGALRSGLAAQQQAGRQAVARGAQSRSAEQARGQQDYVNYLKAQTDEQVAQDRINAAYSQMNLDVLLSEQEGRRKRRGSLFSGVGGLLAAIIPGGD